MRTYTTQKLNDNIIMDNSTLQKKNACSYEQQYQVKVKLILLIIMMMIIIIISSSDKR